MTALHSLKNHYLLEAVALSFTFCVAAGLIAEDKPKQKPKKPQANQKLVDIESALNAPSRLSFDDSNRISLADLFEKVADAHGVQIRIDKNIAAQLVNLREEMLVAEGEIPGSNRSAKNANIAATATPVIASPTATYVPSSVQVVGSSSPAYTGGPLNPTPLPAGTPYPVQVPSYSQPGPAAATLIGLPVASGTLGTIEEPAQPTTTLPSGTVNSQKPVVNEPLDVEVTDEENVEEILQLTSRTVEMLLETEITTVGLQHPGASLESVLMHALDHVSTLMDLVSLEGELPIPFRATHAYDLTLLIEKDHVLVTTVAAANLHKTTKVYSVSNLGEIDSETLANVITKTIRPWSWRSQINELVDQVSADWPESISIPKVNIDLTGVSTGDTTASSEGNDSTEIDLKSLRAMGQLLSSGTVAAAHAVISGTEILHYADPPTAVIETLPGMLVITQSQGAHREIEDLIDQLRNLQQQSE